jgi:hypothetical protein
MKLKIFFIVLAILSLYMYNIREGFIPAKYPTSLLLEDWYPLHKPEPTISSLNNIDQYVNYPLFSSDYNNINNLRQWRKPNNGKCNPAKICGNFYADREITMPTPVPSPGFNKGLRVNYYNVCLL